MNSPKVPNSSTISVIQQLPKINTTSATTISSVNVQNSQIAVTIVFLLVISFLAIIFFLSKKHKRQRRNRQHLFEMLLLSDSCYLAFSIPLIYTVNEASLETTFRLLFGCIVNTFTLISMEMYIFLSLDVYIAVRYSLRYAVIFPLSRVKSIVSLTLITTAVVSMLLNAEPPVRRFSRNTRYGFDSLTIAFRFGTSFALQTLGWITKSIRARQNCQLQRRCRVFGENAEKLSALRSLKRQVKDMGILNTWNALFFVPLGVCTISHLLSFSETVSQLDISLRLIQSTMSPFVNVLSQSSYRKVIQRLFKTKRVEQRERGSETLS